MSDPAVRDYRTTDEASWLRCRALSFLGTEYHDDVRRHRPVLEPGAVALVAVRPRPPEVTTPGADQVIGILDVELSDDGGVLTATIDTVAVHPDHQRRGVADALVAHALERARAAGARVLEAWTREDPAADAWYRAHGMTPDQDYLHVYKGYADDGEGFLSPAPLSAPVTAFAHARLADEAQVRARFARVHRCRRFSRDLP